MKKIYTAPIKLAVASNFKMDENNNIKFDRKNEIIENNVEFYISKRDIAIRKRDKMPVIRESEVYDIIIHDYNSYRKEGIINIPNIYVQYVDIMDLKFSHVEHKKTLKKSKK